MLGACSSLKFLSGGIFQYQVLNLIIDKIDQDE